jgi:hypothetical protein
MKYSSTILQHEYKYYIHMYVNEKMIPVETISGMGERRE